MSPTPAALKTVSVPVTDPAHPSHKTVLETFLMIVTFLSKIAPAVVTIADPAAAPLANAAAQVATETITTIEAK